MSNYKPRQYAKILPDGTLDIVTDVLVTPAGSFKYPSEARCASYGYYPLDMDAMDNCEGYKVIPEGHKEIIKNGKKHIAISVRKLLIVDDGPKPGPGQEVKSDRWKEIDGKWVHVYKYRSVSRHVNPTKFEEKPLPTPEVEEAKPEEPVVVEETVATDEPMKTEESVEETTVSE